MRSKELLQHDIDISKILDIIHSTNGANKIDQMSLCDKWLLPSKSPNNECYKLGFGPVTLDGVH